jgi:DNA topoisomerase-1
MNLIVVESPTKARTLSRFLGDDYVLEATMGHIKDLPKSKLGVDVENDFRPDYLIVKDKDKSIKKIRKQAKNTDAIFIATDPDREGEAIAQHVKEILEGYTTKRIVFHEITKSAVDKAIKNPMEVNNNLVDAQIARRVLDRLVGYKLSPLLWKKVRRGLSAGRVQTVVVRLIVEREREIEAFVPVEYWEIFCKVKTQKPKDKSVSFDVKLSKIDGKKAIIENNKSAKEIVANLESADYSVADVKKREVHKNPFPPFTTSTVTQAAARSFFWSAKRTMTVAQKLYERGLITYHRTDSTNIAKSAIVSVRSFIEKEYGRKYLPKDSRFYKTKAKVAQEAHEAIRPTKVARKIVKDGKIQGAEKLYKLIWQRFVACQMPASVYDETVVEVAAASAADETKYLLRIAGQIMKFDGWRKVANNSQNNGQVKQLFPDVEMEEPLGLIKVNPEQKFTEPPRRFGEASLIRTLEKLGIGRPSTYAPTISRIQVRNYVEKKEGKFHSTPVGVAVNDFLIKYFPKVFEYSFTAAMEDDLDNIANGKKQWVAMMKRFYQPFENKLNKVTEKSKRVKIETEKLGKKCPKCAKESLPADRRGELVIRIGRFGKFISCSRFPDCDHTEKYLEKIGMLCPDCGKGDVIIKTTKTKRRFYGCSQYPDCKYASWKNPNVSKQTS